jgi:hypothetical protein
VIALRTSNSKFKFEAIPVESRLIKPASRADASSARRRRSFEGRQLLLLPLVPPDGARCRWQAAPPSPRRSVPSWPPAVPLNLYYPMSSPLHARPASCPTPRRPRLHNESRTCPPAFMSIPSCPEGMLAHKRLRGGCSHVGGRGFHLSDLRCQTEET